MPAGRPSSYTPETASAICAQLAQGVSLRTVCKADDMPSLQTVFNWMRAHPDFLEQYVRAKQESADALVEEMTDIADDGTNDWMERENERTGRSETVFDHEHVQRSKLRVDTRKWIASKLKPKKYGEKIDHTHAGKIGLEHLVAGSLQASEDK